MRPTPKVDEALEIAVKYVIRGGEYPGVKKIGNLVLPGGSPEATRCEAIRKIVKDYCRRNASSPLAIAVFGPPGSGKSHCVREIVQSAKGCSELFVVNLSQLAGVEDLSATLSNRLATNSNGKTPAVLIDEFDSPLKGVGLGWLRWFLAPMEDGVFFHDGKEKKIGKAVLFFAGGTAPSFDEFCWRTGADPADYAKKKVPDFISRLHGFIDIKGVNSLDSDQVVRRALLLRRFLEMRWPDVKGAFPIERRLVRSLLQGVHFVHGARSMRALLEASRLPGGGKVQLPDNELRRLHLSRGLLDGKVIGISAGLHDSKAKDVLARLTEALLQNGAILAYGGDFVPEGTLDAVIQAAMQVPDELVTRADRRIRSYLGFPSYCGRGDNKRHPGDQKCVDLLKLPTLSDQERKDLGVEEQKYFTARPLTGETYCKKRHMAWALSLFRMRVRMIRDLDALIVVGGKDSGESWGRFSGVAEEVVLALAMRKPVYVLGGRGGAALAVGRLLGLARTIVNPDGCLAEADEAGRRLVSKKSAYCFEVPGVEKLPRTIQEVRRYLYDRGIETPAWPKNGLNRAENRELFEAAIPIQGRIDPVHLILRGLLRL